MLTRKSKAKLNKLLKKLVNKIEVDLQKFNQKGARLMTFSIINWNFIFRYYNIHNNLSQEEINHQTTKLYLAIAEKVKAGKTVDNLETTILEMQSRRCYEFSNCELYFKIIHCSCK